MAAGFDYYDVQTRPCKIDPLREKSYSKDCETWAEALIMWALVVDAQTSYDSWDISEWVLKLSSYPVRPICQVLKKLDQTLLRLAANDTTASFECMVNTLTDLEKEICTTVCEPIQTIISSFKPSDQPVTEFKELHQHFAFILRVNLTCTPLTPQVDNYLSVEEQLAGITPRRGLLNALNCIVSQWFSGFRVTSLPFHSNGAVADTKVDSKLKRNKRHSSINHSLFNKYSLVKPDEALATTLMKYGYNPWHYAWAQDPTSRCSKMVFVPKDALKQRSISMEPATLQAFQHAVQSDIYTYFREHPYLSRRINLQDSTVNMKLAQSGSRTGKLATVDLSHASDSVSLDVVEYIFAGTELYDWLMATRSIYTQLPESDTSLRLRKFAPMGSALCFPVECIIFAATCEYVVLTCTEDCKSRYHVYGDDIVIESFLVPILQNDLESLGFEVNCDKTFYDRNEFTFRESCGGEYYGGVDVAPMRIPRKFQGGKLSCYTPSQVGSRVDMANTAHTYGFYELRNYLMNRLRTSLSKELFPIVGVNSGFHWIGSQLTDKPRRWNVDLQCMEYSGPVVVDKTVKRQLRPYNQLRTVKTQTGRYVTKLIPVTQRRRSLDDMAYEHWLITAARVRKNELLPELLRQAVYDDPFCMDYLFSEPFVSLIGDGRDFKEENVLQATWVRVPTTTSVEDEEYVYDSVELSCGEAGLVTQFDDPIDEKDGFSDVISDFTRRSGK